MTGVEEPQENRNTEIRKIINDNYNKLINQIAYHYHSISNSGELDDQEYTLPSDGPAGEIIANCMGEMIANNPSFVELEDWQIHKMIHDSLEYLINFLCYTGQLETEARHSNESFKDKEPGIRIQEGLNKLAFWSHRNLEEVFVTGLDHLDSFPDPYNTESWPFLGRGSYSKDKFEQLAEEYLSEEFHSPFFEKQMVEALVSMMVFEFGEKIKKNPSTYGGTLKFRKFEQEVKNYRKTKGNLSSLAFELLKNKIIETGKRAGIFVVFPFIAGLFILFNEFNFWGIRELLGFSLIGISGVVLCCWLVRRVFMILLRQVAKFFGLKPQSSMWGVNFELMKKLLIIHKEFSGISISPRRAKYILERLENDIYLKPPIISPLPREVSSVKDLILVPTVLFSILDRAIARGDILWINKLKYRSIDEISLPD
jgi:hypothetical protein